jgi:hypothetical protein
MPHRTAMSSVETVLTIADACQRFGVGRLRWMVKSGRWQSPARGVVVLHSGPMTADEVVQSEVFAHGPRAVLGGVSAASADGLRLPRAPAVHILLPHGSRDLRRPGVVVHRSRTLVRSDIHPVRAPRRTRLPRSVVDGASWAATDLGAQALLASAVQQKLVTPQALSAVVERLPRLPRRALISETIRDVAGGSLSEYELLFVRLCRRYHLPMPDRQRLRRDATGRWRYLDAEFDEVCLVVEIDGQQHMEVRAWWEDMMRDNDLVARDGMWVMRIAGYALRREPDRVAEVLRMFFERHS